jgi:CheY-like chemotaxis protein
MDDRQARVKQTQSQHWQNLLTEFQLLTEELCTRSAELRARSAELRTQASAYRAQAAERNARRISPDEAHTRDQREEFPMRPMTILVIDDLEEVRAVVAELLSHEGYHVLTASSIPGAEAVRERLGLEALSVVVTNLRLTRAPDAREGIDLIHRWHALHPHLPFILMSGDLPPHEAASLPAKVICLSKPFEIQILLNTVQEAIHSSRFSTGNDR